MTRALVRSEISVGEVKRDVGVLEREEIEERRGKERRRERRREGGR